MHWAAIVFGWPAALSSIVLSTVGLVIRWPMFVAVGAVVGLPFMFYLFMTPRFWLVALTAAPCHLCAALALARGRVILAWLLFLPAPLLTWYVAAAVSGVAYP